MGSTPVVIEDSLVALVPLLRWFRYEHLAPNIQPTSRLFAELAVTLVADLPPTAERTVALRKLLEAKDAAVRARIDADGP